jgi:predicted CopG family antitoxin
MSLMLKTTNVSKNVRAKGIYNKLKSRIRVENRSFAIIIYKVIKKQTNLKLTQLYKRIFYIRDLR